MAHGVLIQNDVQAMNIDAFVRSAVCATTDIDNGNVVALTGISSTAGQGEVWVAATPATANLNAGLWMACEPEVVVTVSGTSKYKGIDPDVRNFYNAKGEVFTVNKLEVGDIVTLTDDALAGTKSTNTYVVATNNTAKLTWSADAISGLSLKLIDTTYISIADGSIGTQRTTAYRFYVEALA